MGRKAGVLIAIGGLIAQLMTAQATTQSGPGGTIVYGTPKALLRVAPNGSHKRTLFKGGDVVPQTITVSPSGSKISFLQWVESASHWTLRVTSLSTGRTKKVVPPPVLPYSSTDSLSAGVWSHDGSRLAVNRTLKGLWLVKPDGSRLRRLVKGGTANYSWSSNDSRIAFNRIKGHRGSGPISYFDLRRDKLHRIGPGYRPRWSPTRALVAATTYGSGGR